MLLSDKDRFSSAEFLRTMGPAADNDVIDALARKFPDGDMVLAAALNDAPAVLGVRWNERGRRSARRAHSGARTYPYPRHLAGRRRGGSAADDRGERTRVRRHRARCRRGRCGAPFPLLVVTEDQVRPRFAVEVLRVSFDASSYIVDTTPPHLRIGPLAAPLDADAALRIAPESIATWTDRTISALQILAGSDPRMKSPRGLPATSCSSAAAHRRSVGCEQRRYRQRHRPYKFKPME